MYQLPATPKKHGLLFHALDIIINVVVIVSVVALVRTFLVSPFQVDGSSMDNTLADHEYIIINKLTYFLQQPKRGDVVVFHPPNDPKKYYVKRVIGVPGDTLVIRDGFVYIAKAGEEKPLLLDESDYLNASNLGQTFRYPPQSGDRDAISYTVPEGKYFLLGDNRRNSLDSRGFSDQNGNPMPYVEQNHIRGKVWVVALPITKIQALTPPSYAR